MSNPDQDAQLEYEDPDFLETQRRLAELEEQADMLEKQTDQQTGGLEHQQMDESMDEELLDTTETDKRSVYVGQVDYGATPQELQEHFRSCGTINRITILVDKYTGYPKGFAYVEFADEAAVANAILLNDTMFRGRQIKVMAKRTNIPGLKRGRGRGRGRGMPMMPMMPMMPWGMMGGFMPRGRGLMRGRGRGGFRPY
jgi:polyadenylate-binding protein 2